MRIDMTELQQWHDIESADLASHDRMDGRWYGVKVRENT